MGEFIEIEALDRAVIFGKEGFIQGRVRHHHTGIAAGEDTDGTSVRWIDYLPVVRVEESGRVIEMNFVTEGVEHTRVITSQRDSHRVYRQRVTVEACIFTISRVKRGVTGAPPKRIVDSGGAWGAEAWGDRRTHGGVVEDLETPQCRWTDTPYSPGRPSGRRTGGAA